jgi:GrpB-like predicted nucleotidyltransferase (UPF0157 family)
MGDWTHGQARLVASDPRWPAALQRLAAELRATLGDLAAAVEHVSSTAVPGLAAKPILDIAIDRTPGTDPDQVTAALERLGYQLRGHKGDDGGLVLVLEDRPAHRSRTCTWSATVTSSGAATWRCQTGTRRSRRQAAYAQRKQRLATQFSGDRRAYTAAKAAFIAQLLASDDAPPHGSSSRAVATARPCISGGTTPSSRSNPTRAGAATTTVTSGPPRPAATDTDASPTPATPESPADPAR